MSKQTKSVIESMVEQSPVVETIKTDTATLSTLREMAAIKSAESTQCIKDYAHTLCAYFDAQGVKDWVSAENRKAEKVTGEKTLFIELCEKRSHSNPSQAWAMVVKYATRKLHGVPDRTTNALSFTDSLLKDFRAIESRLQSEKNQPKMVQAHIDLIAKYIRPAIDALKKIK